MAIGETYEEFVDKFKPKKTTDDCYTPPSVYTVISDGAVVLDNPPFSILTSICQFYLDRGIQFFLFAPSLTCLGGKSVCMRMNHLICNCNIEYDNGAIVRTSFVTSYSCDDTRLCIAWSRL